MIGTQPDTGDEIAAAIADYLREDESDERDEVTVVGPVNYADLIAACAEDE